MPGPLVNAATIMICSLIGRFLLRGIPGRFEEIIKKAIGLAVIYVGIKGALESRHVLLLIMSMVIGAVLGELVNIDKRMNALGGWAERKLSGGAREKAPAYAGGPPGAGNAANASNAVAAGRSFSRGFVSASVIFCSGSMAIVGSIQSGLEGNHELLFAKSILDGSISIVFGASMGIGVFFSAVPVLLYEGGMALASLAIRDFLTQEIITEMSAAGSLLIAAIGFNFLSVKEIRVTNLVPAVFVPWAYFAVRALAGSF
ncbi:MAG: DUF554 domain-containing protein [Treponema sp.]|jgi:uncharacterized membrane protein YqgA involved in biofilm formation|nr:DUF554 domain-containing protein [Treponema sp.]